MLVSALLACSGFVATQIFQITTVPRNSTCVLWRSGKIELSQRPSIESSKQIEVSQTRAQTQLLAPRKPQTFAHFRGSVLVGVSSTYNYHEIRECSGKLVQGFASSLLQRLIDLETQRTL